MAPLHRCVHIHACMGRLRHFSDSYAQNRRQQLEADLALHGGSYGYGGRGSAAAGSFLEHYQPLLSQLVGYFLIEDRVQRQAGEQLDIAAQVDAAWECAVAALKALLEPAFQGATAAAAMLTVKDFLLLVCPALGEPRRREWHLAVLGRWERAVFYPSRPFVRTLGGKLTLCFCVLLPMPCRPLRVPHSLHPRAHGQQPGPVPGAAGGSGYDGGAGQGRQCSRHNASDVPICLHCALSAILPAPVPPS